MISFNAEQVARGDYKAYSPEQYDFVWNRDYTECVAYPLAWHDDASYAAYQGDPEEAVSHDPSEGETYEEWLAVQEETVTYQELFAELIPIPVVVAYKPGHDSDLPF